MNVQNALRYGMVAATLGLVIAFAHAGAPLVGTAFTYQGELRQGGQPVNATADFQFSLFAAMSGGSALAGPLAANNVSLADGRFTVSLDFGANVFDGSDRYLEIAVRSPAGGGAFTTLAPRQRIAPTPYAIHTRGIHVNAAGDFVGIGRTTSITSAESFGVNASGAGGGFGGMYVNTDAVDGKPFYGYATGGLPRAYHYYEAGVGHWILINGSERLRFSSSGNVGIGESLPVARLHARAESDTVAIFNRTGTDGTIVSFWQDSSQQGTISVAGSTVSYNAFTGSHYGWTQETIERGSLVTMIGVNHRLHGDADSEVLYGIVPTAIANDPKCLGAYLGPQEPNQATSDDNPHLVMAVGNGEMWVTDAGGDIQPGDYLISSDVLGCAMKDDPQRFPIGHIVARAAEGVDWESIAPSQAGVKRMKISVFFGSFVRNSEAAGLSDEVQALRRLVESQSLQISALAERLDATDTLASKRFTTNQSRTGESP